MDADVNKADNFGRTPLHVAAADNYPDMINVLIDAGGTYS
jgi:ankyrin repeat protein